MLDQPVLRVVVVDAAYPRPVVPADDVVLDGEVPEHRGVIHPLDMQ